MAAVQAIAAGADKSKGLHYKNPRVPVNIKLPDNLECGMKIYVHGAVMADPKRFSVNLKNAELDANTYLHFNPRFGEDNAVVRNSRLDGAWGSEERDGDNPFTPGTNFVILLYASPEGYEIEVDGNPFTVFPHREGMPLCDVTHLTVKGDIVVYGIHVPVSSMPIPLSLSIPGKTALGDMFFIRGSVPDGSDRFAVNFQCGSGGNADVMFHLNPRLSDGVVVCNSKCADSWDAEEREGSMPISPGEDVEVCVCASEKAFQTYINGAHFINFNHRLNMAAACTLAINGDITVNEVCIDCLPCLLPPQTSDVKVREFENPGLQLFYPTIPGSYEIVDGMEPGKVVVVTGTVPSDPSRFKMNLQCSGDDDADVALHFNPRWDQDDPVLVMNAREGGDWGDEVRQTNIMTSGSSFQLDILCQEEAFCISVNGVMLGETFPYRIDCRRVNHVAFGGSINIQRVAVA